MKCGKKMQHTMNLIAKVAVLGDTTKFLSMKIL